MSKKVPYEVSSSSLYNLKAELYRKQAEFQQKKQAQDGSGFVTGYQAVQSKTKVHVAKVAEKPSGNPGVAARNQRDLEMSVPTEDEKRWEFAKSNLAAKAKIYDQMNSGAITTDPNEDEHVLIDFQRKAMEGKHFDSQARRRYSESESDSDSDDDIPSLPPSFNEGEWTEYEDYLGRSRKCLKKDLPGLLKENQKLAGETADHSAFKTSLPEQGLVSGPQSAGHFDFGPVPLDQRTLLSKDMERELERQQWEEEAVPSGPVGPIHYQMYEAEENRNMGVGYYKFSTDEATRNEQMKELKRLREQTLATRSGKEFVRAKRDAMKEARLAKVRERKQIKGDSVKETEDDEDDWDFEKALQEKQKPPPVPEAPVRIGPPPAREWDSGKKKPSEKDPRDYMEEQRSRRDLDFAPPSSYSAPTKYGSNKNFKRPPPSDYCEYPSAVTDEKKVEQEEYKPWEHVQPWKKPAQDYDRSSQPAEDAASDRTTDERRPWAFAPPPSMYNEQSSTSMTFNRISKGELQEHARDYLNK